MNQDLKDSLDLKNGKNVSNGDTTRQEKSNNESTKSPNLDISKGRVDNTTVDIKSLFHVSIEWKFECQSCQRYIVTKMQVIKWCYVDK